MPRGSEARLEYPPILVFKVPRVVVATANRSFAWQKTGLCKSIGTRATLTSSNWNNKHKLLCALEPSHRKNTRHYYCCCCWIKYSQNHHFYFQTWKLGFLFSPPVLFLSFIICFLPYVSVNKRANLLVQMCLTWWSKHPAAADRARRLQSTNPKRASPGGFPLPNAWTPLVPPVPSLSRETQAGDFLFSGP